MPSITNHNYGITALHNYGFTVLRRKYIIGTYETQKEESGKNHNFATRKTTPSLFSCQVDKGPSGTLQFPQKVCNIITQPSI